MSPKSKFSMVGVRPGEKINELMCSVDESNQVIKFKNYFIILPSIKNFAPARNKYLISSLKEKGKFVSNNFEFSSGNNSFLSINEIKKKIKSI